MTREIDPETREQVASRYKSARIERYRQRYENGLCRRCANDRQPYSAVCRPCQEYITDLARVRRKRRTLEAKQGGDGNG